MRNMKRKGMATVMMVAAFLVCLATMYSCGNAKQEKAGKARTENRLMGQAKAWDDLAKAAKIIDSDDESFWAYGVADSILLTTDGKDSPETQAKINSAVTYIYYGMSYTRTIRNGSAGQDPIKALTDLSAIINKNMQTDYYSLLRNELRAIYAAIFFYKMSNMSSAPGLDELCNIEKKHLTKMSDNPSEDEVRAASSRIKKLWFKVYAQFIVDLTGDDSKLMDYAAVFDALPGTAEEVKAMGDAEYNKALEGCTTAQTAMVNDLVDGINRIPKEK